MAKSKSKSYSNIWRVEKILYSISDLKLPFPVTYSQMAWFVVSILAVIMLGDVPPLSMINNMLIKYIVIPVGITWFMSKKTFDGKRPFAFLKTCILYALRPKVTYAGRAVKLKKENPDIAVTVVRSELYVPD